MKIIVTNIPAFYKINLYNEINRKCKLHVIFIDSNESDRNSDFISGDIEFDYTVLSGNLKSKIKEAKSIIDSIDYDELIIGGWDHPILWHLAFTYPKHKNSMFIESSYFDSTTSGLKGFIKKLFINRISKVYASGKSQKKITDSLGFKGHTKITKGVGIFNYIDQPLYQLRKVVKDFLYVGRLVEVKNLKLLINVFNSFPELNLHIIGFGELETSLKSIANNNIHFHGAVENKKLSEYYQKFDVFILPSIIEPWGLVVEEALNNGMPVIVSNRVGCAEEIINDNNGCLFHYDDPDDLRRAIKKMTEIGYYNNLRYNISKMNFEQIENKQVEAYL